MSLIILTLIVCADATIRVDICFLSAMEDMIELSAPNNTLWFYELTNSWHQKLSLMNI